MDKKKAQLEWKTCLRVGVSAFALFLCVYYWDVAAGFLSALFGAVAPILLGGVLAYLVNILMSFYERHWFPKKSGKALAARVRRPLCMLGAIATLIAVVALVIGLVVPEFISCVDTLA